MNESRKWNIRFKEAIVTSLDTIKLSQPIFLTKISDPYLDLFLKENQPAILTHPRGSRPSAVICGSRCQRVELHSDRLTMDFS